MSWWLKATYKQLCDQRISRAVANIADEEGETDWLAGSGMWPGELCAPRIFVKAMCNAFTAALERLEERGRCHALECPVTPKTQFAERKRIAHLRSGSRRSQMVGTKYWSPRMHWRRYGSPGKRGRQFRGTR